MGAVLWSVVFHAMLHSTQPLQPLRSTLIDSKAAAQKAESTLKYTGMFGKAKKGINPSEHFSR